MESLNHKRVLSNFISRESEQKRFFSNDSLTPSGSEKSFNLRRAYGIVIKRNS